MTTHYLRHFFNPDSIAVIGASERPGSLGTMVFANLRAAGFKGQLHAVNPKHRKVCGQPCYRTVNEIADKVDLAIIASPGRVLAGVLKQCGQKDIRAAIILGSAPATAKQQADIETLSRRFGIRLVGPDCLGIMRPSAHLNATPSPDMATPGRLALVAQSATLGTATLDWARARSIGFSTVISLGNASDVEFGDVLDFLATDAETHSILLHIEAVPQPRRFMSGLRAAARLKPVIVMKAGRHQEAAQLITARTGTPVGADDVFDAALARAGAVRVLAVDQLFAAAAALAAGHRASGNRLAIVTNGGGPAVLATDRAIDLGLTLPQLSEDSSAELTALLPRQQIIGNPIDLPAGTPADFYAKAVDICLKDNNVDGVLALFIPRSEQQSVETASTLIAGGRRRKPLLLSWLGASRVQQARQLFTTNRLPHFDTPEAAVEAYSYLAQYQRNQRLLLQVPGAMAFRPEPGVQNARFIIESAVAEGRSTLSPIESKALLTAFDIPVVRTLEARNINEALVHAESLGYPVAMKISSPALPHAAAIGGVRLNITAPQMARAAFTELVSTAHSANPDAHIVGVTIERMHGKEHARELAVGIGMDPVFGPVVTFGAGGSMIELIRDRAVGLPPLNEIIARDMIRRSRAARLLQTYENQPTIDEQLLVQILLQLSDMICKLPHIRELDINPLIIDEAGALALDARFVVGPPPPGGERYPHMAISPYPMHLVSQTSLPDGSNVTIRPIRPEDAEIEQDFVHRLSAESKYFRFMEQRRELTTSMLVRFTQIDYDREMALIATRELNEAEQQIGVARYVILPDGTSCEFALAISDEMQGQGLGTLLMNRLMEVAAAKGLATIQGDVLSSNAKMLALMRRLGFSVRPSRNDFNIRIVEKSLLH